MSDDEQLELPGLEEPPAAAGALELAVRKTIRALDDLNLLEPRHALTCQLMIELAQAVAAGRAARRASAVALAAAQLREAFLSLPEPETEGGTDDAWTQLADDLRAAGEAAIRDGAGS